MAFKATLFNIAELEGTAWSLDGARLSLQALRSRRFGSLAHILADGRKLLQAYIKETIVKSRTDGTVSSLSMAIHLTAVRSGAVQGKGIVKFGGV